MTRPHVIGSDGKPIFAFSRSKAKGKRTNASPEDDFQRSLVRYLTLALDPELYRFRAGLEGIRLSMNQAVRAKAMGMRRGWPDVEIVSRRSGAVRWLEAKARGALSAEQKEFIADNPKFCAVVRTIDDAERALIAWGVTPRCAVGAANRYGTGGTE